jgi:hypothetical protein
LQWKPSVCEQNIFHTPSACSGVVHYHCFLSIDSHAKNEYNN